MCRAEQAQDSARCTNPSRHKDTAHGHLDTDGPRSGATWLGNEDALFKQLGLPCVMGPAHRTPRSGGSSTDADLSRLRAHCGLREQCSPQQLRVQAQEMPRLDPSSG